MPSNAWQRFRYTIWAPHYDRVTKFHPERRRSIDLLGLRPGERLLIIGCGTGADIPFVPDARTLKRMQILTLDTPDGGLDVLVDPSGSPGYRALKERAKRIDFDGSEILIASIEDLLAMKQAGGRPQDLADIEALRAIERMLRSEER